MSEVQTVSATVHEIAHSKLHDPKKYEMLPSWKVVQESEGGTKHDFKLDFATEKEAEQFASDMDWRSTRLNKFRRIGNKHTSFVGVCPFHASGEVFFFRRFPLLRIFP